MCNNNVNLLVKGFNYNIYCSWSNYLFLNHPFKHLASSTLDHVTFILLYYIKLKSRLPVCLSVCIFGTQITASIETELARNESCVFEEHKSLFYKPTEPTVHGQECIKDEGVSSH